jgi:hypothetical protein
LYLNNTNVHSKLKNKSRRESHFKDISKNNLKGLQIQPILENLTKLSLLLKKCKIPFFSIYYNNILIGIS